MKGFQCDELFAFVAVDDDGNEGIVSADKNNGVIPLVCSSLEIVKLFIPIAKIIAEGNKINIKLYRYRREGEVPNEFLEQFVDVRLTGDPGGSGQIPTGDDEEDEDANDTGDSTKQESDGGGKAH